MRLNPSISRLLRVVANHHLRTHSCDETKENKSQFSGSYKYLNATQGSACDEFLSQHKNMGTKPRFCLHQQNMRLPARQKLAPRHKSKARAALWT